MNSKELLKIWIESFNRKDIEAVMNCYAEGAVNFQVATDAPSIGREQIRMDNVEFFRAFPDAWAKVENLIGEGGWAAWEWIGGGTFLGEFYGNAPTGKAFELRGCGFFQFTNDKIIFQRGYWDKLTWFSQIGLPIE